MAQLSCIGLPWPLTKPPFGICVIYFHHGVNTKKKKEIIVNTVDGRNPAPADAVDIPVFIYIYIHMVLYIPGGAGFLPSTVVNYCTSGFLNQPTAN